MLKTVICPECGAEQAIIRDKNGEVHCVFCNCAITDLPPVSDDEDFPDVQRNESKNKTAPVGQAIKTEYILNREEVEKALILSGKLRSRKYIVWAETIVLVFFVLVMLFSILAGYNGWWNMNKPDMQTYFILILAAALIPFVWIMPNRSKKRIVDSKTSGNKISLAVYENLAEIDVEDAQKMQLVFNDGFNVVQQDGITIIIMKSGHILAVPDRAFKDDELDEAKKRILTGYQTV